MGFIVSSKTQPAYDVIVVGSGAGGGQAAYVLAMEGARVLMLEAGRRYDPVTETPMFQPDFLAPLRGASTPDKPGGFFDATIDGGFSIPGEPYTNASEDPRRQFSWWRARMLGGRSNHWARHALRNGPYDFKPRSRDGLGFDWPISYEDLAPYYDRVEMLVGVYGGGEDLENTPPSPPGIVLPPPPMRAHERLAQQRGKGLGIPIISSRRAVLTRTLDWQTIPAKLHPNNPRAQSILAREMRDRQACFWATNCGRGCSIKANYQSPTVHLPPALATGNLDVLPNAMAREVTVDASGKATGVIYIDKTTGREARATARAVVLAASSGETVRLLLNSKGGGKTIHEVGGTMMGADPKASVTNAWGQTWDVKNLFVTDGAPFCSNADKNPTLTIMALAWRSADHLVEQLRKGDV